MRLVRNILLPHVHIEEGDIPGLGNRPQVESRDLQMFKVFCTITDEKSQQDRSIPSVPSEEQRRQDDRTPWCPSSMQVPSAYSRRVRFHSSISLSESADMAVGETLDPG